MKSGEIYEFKLPSGGAAFARIVLDIRRLGGPPGGSLSFVGDSLLIQVDAQMTFTSASLAINGMFLHHHRQPKSVGLIRVGFSQVAVEEIEFPCWFSTNSGRRSFCRGVIQTPVAQSVYERWPVRLSSAFVERLPHIAEDHLLGNLTGKHALWRHDVRYHPDRATILSEVDEDLRSSYIDAVRNHLGAASVESYRSAVNA